MIMEKKEFGRKMRMLKYEDEIEELYKREVIKLIDEIAKILRVKNKSLEVTIASMNNTPRLFGVSNFLAKIFFSKEINMRLEKFNLIQSYNVLYDYIKE